MIYDAPSLDSMMHAQTQNAVIMLRETPADITPPYALSKNSQQINLQKFSDKLSRVSSFHSSAQCTKSIRIALQTAGAKIAQHPIAASDWGGTLQKIGYKQIEPAFDNPMPGDIYIIHRTKKHVYGHIAGFTGSQWVSDFKQTSYDVYKDKNVTYTYYRLG
ncbi:CHAP domain-containing protein [Acinetobacter sp. SwsAc4]|uniref:CHAP domain-containing protein n=1 Tax=Acinetobacter sp. SwsAc4 TaxID=2749437 RepID=UPI0015BF053A|nr:CHAP domain-containing protein [Acinetobacter sp. SwsAc4]NWK82441.1 CHAP domain-containing protein [Acinetobacter sp. SwsAc4]